MKPDIRDMLKDFKRPLSQDTASWVLSAISSQKKPIWSLTVNPEQDGQEKKTVADFRNAADHQD